MTVALDRTATGNNVQGPAVFLASDAPRYVASAILPVDGGWTAV